MSREAMKHIKTWSERCEEHPDHQTGMISERMIQERMQEEIDELRQALEEKQEPVAHIDHRIHGWPDCFVIRADPPHTSPLYLSLPKREWVGLTEEEREFLLHQALRFYDTNAQLLSFIKTVEEKLKEKNT